MRAKFIYEGVKEVLKPKELSKEVLDKWHKHLDNLSIDDVWEYLNNEQQQWIEELDRGRNTIKGMYDDKWHKNGGWNGMMDAINEYSKYKKLKTPDFDNLPEGIDIWKIIMDQF